MNDKIGFDIIDKGFQEDLEKERNQVRAELEEEIKNGKASNFSQSDTDWMLANYPYANTKQRDKAVDAESEKKQRQKAAFDAEVEKRLGEKQDILEQLHFGKHGRQFALEQAAREEKIKAFKQKQQDKREQEKKAHHQTTEQSKAKGKTLAKEQKESLAEDQDNTKQHTLSADFNTSAPKGKAAIDAKMNVEQFKERQRQRAKLGKGHKQSKTHGHNETKPERKTPYITDDFNIAHSKQEIEDWQDSKPAAQSNVDSRLIYDFDREASQGHGEQNEQGEGDLSDTFSSGAEKEEEFKEKMRRHFNQDGQEQGIDLEPEI